MLETDQKLAEYLENVNRSYDGNNLSIEIISGDKLFQKFNSNDIDVASKYSSVRYIVNKEFGFANNQIHGSMIIGNVASDFQPLAKWFILSDNNLIVSVLCYLSGKTYSYVTWSL